jgi:DNA mismatch endonuclease, patch repair protein
MVQVGEDQWSTASVELKRLPKGRRVYGYLRYTQHGRTVNRYIGDVTSESRRLALRKGWDLARRKGLLDGNDLE